MDLNISYNIFELSQLSAADQTLVKSAEAGLAHVHAPYSNFSVGSAVRDASGKVTAGSNQENAAYPSGLCAERVAIFAAKSQSKVDLEAIVVLAKNEKGESADAFSCGNCRQVMMEYASIQEAPIKIIMQRKEGDFVVLDDVRFLLPFSFASNSLK
ncbi:MAG: cytidine deaminase [Cyclobacteriaceae bacterium]